jgi:hypothetical protein
LIELILTGNIGNVCLNSKKCCININGKKWMVTTKRTIFIWIWFLLPVLVVTFSCSPKTLSELQSLPAEQDKAGFAVTSVEQAVKLVQQFEKQLYDRMYGKDKPHPPLASAEKPHSVVEKVAKKENYYVFEFRKPFGPAGGGYIKTFYVNRRTGRVTRGAWKLGR